MSTRWDLERDGKLLRISMIGESDRRPPTLDLKDFDEFHSILESLQKELKQDPSALRLVVLQARSPLAFSAGADIRVLETMGKATIEHWVRKGHKVLAGLERLPVPTIAHVAASAYGGGLELALACDHIITLPHTTFGLTETKLGFVPGWGGSRRLLKRIGYSKAIEMLAKGKVLSAEQALGLGLVDFVGDQSALDQWVTSYAEDLEQTSGFAVARAKAILCGLAESEFDLAEQLEARGSLELFEGGDTHERLTQFLQSRAAKRGKQNHEGT